MLNLLTKRFFDISLLLKLKFAAISLILWTVNKSCYIDSRCLHENTKIIGLKRKTFVEIISTFQWNQHVRKVSVNKTFSHVLEEKKAMLLRHSTCIPSSVKLPLFKLNITFHFKCYLHLNCSINLNWNNTQLYSSVKPLHNVPSSVFWLINFCFLPFLPRTSIQKWKNWFC